MAEETKQTVEQPTTTPEPPKEPTARERYRSRYQEKHPDLNLDDEDAFYGQANANLDELENFRESDRQLGAAMDQTPLLAGLVLAAKEGENPFTWLAENIGPDMDVRELANDPEFGKKMGEALVKFQERQAKGQQAEKEFGDNLQTSIDALKQVAQERNMSDEDMQALYKRMYGEADEEGNVISNGIFGDASIGIVPKEIWEAVLKAQNYDSDIASAGEKARATALNERMQNGLKNFGSNVPSLSSGSGAQGERKPKKKGGFADWGEDGNV